MEKMHYLFSYGTLRLKEVQMASFGRLLEGESDRLPDYKLENLKITDAEVLATSKQRFHPIAVPYLGAVVEGMRFEISEAELIQSDQYEVSDYKRIQLTLASGHSAWVYVAR